MVSQQFIKFDPQARQLTCLGEWNLAHLVSIKAQLGKIAWPQSGAVTVDGSAVAKLDSAAAWLLRQSLAKLVQHGLTVSLQGFSAPQKKLLSLIEKQTEQITHIPKVHIPPWLARFGKRVVLQINEFREFLAFVGELTLEVLRL